MVEGDEKFKYCRLSKKLPSHTFDSFHEAVSYLLVKVKIAVERGEI